MDVTTAHCHASLEACETHERILEAAQKLFAERGFDATSVRDITAEAKCNVAAVNYHFGGKENLYVEAFRAMLGALRDQRLAVLGELMRRTPAPTLENFLESFAVGFLDPVVDEGRGRQFLVLLSREILDPRMPPSVVVGEFVQPLLDRATQALDRIGTPMKPEVARLCLLSLVGQLLHALKAHHLFAKHRRAGLQSHLGDFVDHFVRFSAAGIRACVVDETQPLTLLTGGESHQ